MRIIKFLITGICLLSVYQGTGQNIDSLRLKFQTTSDPAETTTLGLMLGKAFLYKNQDSAAFYFNAARTELPKVENDSLFIKVYERSSALEEFKGNNTIAIEFAHVALGKARQTGRNEDQEKLYSLLGRYHMRSTHYDSATYYWNLLLKVYADKGDLYGMWLPYHLLAEMYKNLKDWPKSKAYFEKSLASVRLEKKPKDYLFLLYNYMNACDIEGEMDLYSQLKDEYLSFKHEQGLDILGVEHSTMNRIDESPVNRRKRLLTYLPFHIKNKSHFSTCDTYFHLGQTYMEEKNYDAAIIAFTEMIESIESIDLIFLKFAGHSALSNAYARKKDYENALLHFTIKYELHDSMQQIERLKQMNELNIQYETAEKEKQLAETTFSLETSKKNQQLLRLSLFGVLIIAGFMYYAFRTKQKTNKQLEEKNVLISKALREKDILLREIHHRVKNNLQMISALLYLHGKSVDDTTAQEALMESQNRVQSMAMIHQNLYQEDNLLGVSIKDYLDKLLNHLISSYNIEQHRITIHKKIDIPQLDVDTVIPLALIINELISNALKYAFRDGRKGEITISLVEENGVITLKVIDNGMGLPEHFSIASSSNFGLKLINILSDRLGATWSAHSERGTNVTLIIPLRKAA